MTRITRPKRWNLQFKGYMFYVICTWLIPRKGFSLRFTRIEVSHEIARRLGVSSLSFTMYYVNQTKK